MSAEISKAKEAVKEGVSQAKDKAEAAGRDLGRTADSLERRANAAVDSAAELAEEAGDRARGVAHNLRETVRDVGDKAAAQLGTAREALSETGERIAETLRHSAEKADLKKMQESVVNAVSSGVAATATALREGDVAGLADDLRSAARRHPGTFILGAAALGFIAGRFLLASRDEADRRRGGRY